MLSSQPTACFPVTASYVQQTNVDVIAKFLPSKHLTKEEALTIPNTGNCPVHMTMEQFRKVVPLWRNISIEVYKNPVSNKVCGAGLLQASAGPRRPTYKACHSVLACSSAPLPCLASVVEVAPADT